MISIYFTYALYGALSVAILFVFGQGIVMLATPKPLRDHMLLLSPIVGYCFVILIGWFVHRFGLAGTDSYAFYLFIPPLILLGYAVFQVKNRKLDIEGMFNKSLLIPFVIGIICFSVAIIPLLRETESMTSISLGNNDMASYNAQSNELKTMSIYDNSGYLGQNDLPIENIYKLNSISPYAKRTDFTRVDTIVNRFGTPFLIAFYSTILSRETYEMGTLVSILFFVLGVLLFYSLAVKVFLYHKLTAAIMSLIYSFSTVIYFIVYDGFQAQVFGMQLGMAFLLINFTALKSCVKLKDYYLYLPLAILIHWGLNLTYSHMIPFLYGLVMVFIGSSFLKDRSFVTFRNWSLFSLIVLVVNVALAPQHSFSIVSNLLLHSGENLGWDISYLWPSGIFGIFYKSRNIYNMEPSTLELGISFILVVILVVGLFRSFKDNKLVFFIALSVLLYVLGGYHYMYLAGKSQFVGIKYKSFKLISYFLPVIMLSWMVGLRNPFEFKNKIFTKIGIASLVLVLLCSMVNAKMLTRSANLSHQYVSQDMATIALLGDIDEYESFNIMTDSWWIQMWLNSFLLKKEQHFPMSTYAGKNAGYLDGQWDIVGLNQNFTSSRLSGCVEEMRRVNNYFIIRKSKRLKPAAYLATITAMLEGNSFKAGAPKDVSIKVKNMSELTWDSKCNIIFVTYKWKKPDGSVVPGSSNGIKLTRNLSAQQEETFELKIQAPKIPGDYTLLIDLVNKDVAWFYERGSIPAEFEVQVL